MNGNNDGRGWRMRRVCRYTVLGTSLVWHTLPWRLITSQNYSNTVQYPILPLGSDGSWGWSVSEVSWYLALRQCYWVSQAGSLEIPELGDLKGEGFAQLPCGHIDQQRQQNVGGHHGKKTREAMDFFGTNTALRAVAVPMGRRSGKPWDNHRTKRWIFQQTMFDSANICRGFNKGWKGLLWDKHSMTWHT